jgi:hypothetical protein
MRSSTDFLRLKAELGKDRELLHVLLAKNLRATERASMMAGDEFAWAAVGYTIHNIYCLFENYFLRVSKFFENSLDQANWHAQLAPRMTLEIPGRVQLLAGAMSGLVDDFLPYHERFIAAVEGLAAGLDAHEGAKAG